MPKLWLVGQLCCTEVDTSLSFFHYQTADFFTLESGVSLEWEQKWMLLMWLLSEILSPLALRTECCNTEYLIPFTFCRIDPLYPLDSVLGMGLKWQQKRSNIAFCGHISLLCYCPLSKWLWHPCIQQLVNSSCQNSNMGHVKWRAGLGLLKDPNVARRGVVEWSGRLDPKCNVSGWARFYLLLHIWYNLS